MCLVVNCLQSCIILTPGPIFGLMSNFKQTDIPVIDSQYTYMVLITCFSSVSIIYINK